MSIKVSIIIPVYNQPQLVVRALDSIPVREDLEVIVIDDCSTDDTYGVLQEYTLTSPLSITLLHNDHNEGVGHTTNRGYDCAQGHWIIGLDNDDYLLTEEYSQALDLLEEYEDFDMVYIFNEVNSGQVGQDTNRSAIGSYFVKKDFLGEHRMLEQKDQLVDGDFKQELLTLHPRIGSIEKVCYHYNFPRKGSLLRQIRGLD